MENAITKNTRELERLEGIIQENLTSFYELGSALMKIRDSKLYRDVLLFETFEEYCKVKWDFSRQHAYRLIDSASAVDVVSPMGDIPPTSERQVRPLAGLAPDKQREAWKEAVDTAPDGKMTAAHVAKVVKAMTEEAPKAAPELQLPSGKPQEPSDAMTFAEISISQLEKIDF